MQRGEVQSPCPSPQVFLSRPALPLLRQLAPYVVIAGGPEQVDLAVALRGAAREVDAIVMRANEIGVGETSVSVISYLIGQVLQRRREAASH